MVAITALPQAQSPDPELALVASAAAGDNAAFGRLYHRYSASVYNLVLRSVRNKHLAEDLCQEVWVKAHRQLSSLRELGAFSTWLYRIAARSCVDAARKREAGPTTVELTERLAASPASDPEAAAVRGEQERLTWEALGALPTRQHLALFLKEVEGQSYREIANVLDTSESAVETLLFRARRGFAEAFEQLRSGRTDRCGQARTAMSTLFDGEGTPVHRRAVQAHLDDCDSCRQGLVQAQRTSFAYAALPLLPVSPMLADRVLGSLGVASSAGGAGGLIAKLLALGGGNAKMLLAAATLTSGLGAAALVSPNDAPAFLQTSLSPTATHRGVSADAGFEAQGDGHVRAYGSGSAANAGVGVAAQPDPNESAAAAPPSSDEALALVSSIVATVQQALAEQGVAPPPVPAVGEAIGTVEETADGTLGGATDALEPVTGALEDLSAGGQGVEPPAAGASGSASSSIEISPPAIPTPALPSIEDILRLP
jgi:RNA polymerase sigma-70 factor (ECF subfamily)